MSHYSLTIKKERAHLVFTDDDGRAFEINLLSYEAGEIGVWLIKAESAIDRQIATRLLREAGIKIR